MPPVLSDFDASSFVGSLAPVGIVIALIGAVFLSLGAQFQHRGVEQVEASHGSGAKAGLSPGQLFRLLARPWWALGTLMLGLAIVFQLTSLTFAPLIVVQPLGVVALVLTSILNAMKPLHSSRILVHQSTKRSRVLKVTICSRYLQTSPNPLRCYVHTT